MFHKTKKLFSSLLLASLLFMAGGLCVLSVVESARAEMPGDSQIQDGCAEAEKKEQNKNLKPCCAKDWSETKKNSLISPEIFTEFAMADFGTIHPFGEKSVKLRLLALAPPQKEKLASIVKRE